MAFVMAVVVGCLIPVLPANAVEEGFVSLFDGKTLNGWHLMNGAKFDVVDGVIRHDKGHGWLRSDRQYADFHIRMEFRFLKPKQDGGLFVRAGMEGKDWPDKKYEVQIENTARMGKIFNADHKLNVELAKKALKPDGQWNEYDITVVGPKMEVRLNGELVSSSESASSLKKGYLGLQAEDGLHEYRNIRIKEGR
ncbi:MAG: DUF1080 domain-containing protein [Isosphaeraceae bacterium]